MTQPHPAPPADPACASRLANFPIPFFAMIMGLAGLTIVHQRAGQTLWSSALPGQLLAGLTCLLFAVLLTAYTAKMLFYFPRVREEFRSPIKLQFFPTLSISVLLLSILFLPWHTELSFWLWAAGAAAHLVLTLVILSIWIRKEHFEIHHIEPTWFIPVVGNILVPIAGVVHAPRDLSWFFFSIGLIFWLLLFTIFLYRIIFHQPIVEKRLPTFFILIAPPAVGFLSYVRLTGEVDNFARILYFFALFLLLLLLMQWRMFLRIRFFISWWAYSFPLAALTLATFAMREHAPAPWLTWLCWGLTTLVSAVVAILLALTVRAAIRHDICNCEH